MYGLNVVVPLCQTLNENSFYGLSLMFVSQALGSSPLMNLGAVSDNWIRDSAEDVVGNHSVGNLVSEE